MPKILSNAQVRQYHELGYCHPFDVLTTDEAASYLDKLEAYEGASEGPIDGVYRHKPHLLFPWLHDLVNHPQVLDAVEDVLGPNILCWGSSFFNKEAQNPAYVSWHQDSNYWGLDRHDVCTAWIAFTASNKLNGCMRMIPGSHNVDIQHTDTFHKHNLLSRGQEIDVDVDEAAAIDLELAPGEMSLHHVRVTHGSNPNRYSGRRVGFAIRYIASDVRQTLGPRDFATLVRGQETHDYWELEPRPKAELDPEAVAYHASVCEIQGKMLYSGAQIKPFQPRTRR